MTQMDIGLGPTITLESRFIDLDRPVLLSGIQALIRVLLEQSRLDRADPGKQRHLGTRARLAYSCGQLARSEQRFREALDHFSACSYFAFERLRSRTPDLELTGPPTRSVGAPAGQPHRHTPKEARLARQRENDQLHTAWVIGKSLAFGMGWVHYMMGNLSAARHAIGAGHSMLRGTGDWIHRAYAQMLLAATERAQCCGESAVIERALERIQEAERGLAPHPTFGARAAFETALTFWYAARPDEALQALRRARVAKGSVESGTAKTRPSLSIDFCSSVSVPELRPVRTCGLTLSVTVAVLPGRNL